MTKEPIKKYLETLAGYSRDEILSKLRRKFKLSDSQAFEVYTRWRKDYITPEYTFSHYIDDSTIKDDKSFAEAIREWSPYPISKRQIYEILELVRRGKSTSYIAKSVKLSYNKTFSIMKKAKSRGIL